MATGSMPAANVHEEQRFIERQLNRTRRQVKLVELGVAIVTLLVGVFSFFLVAALIDHWVLPLGTLGRFAFLAILLGGVGWFAWSMLIPLVRNSINPAYAALTIEHSTPSLKNSLINFLMLRSHRADVHEVVYEAMEQRAAADLRSVPLDSVIDYSKLIKIGYVLAGLFALCAAYKILSPKDPLQTAARVAAPWADIARPSRVQIEQVEPGDAEKFFGDSVEITASLRGVRAKDRIALVYSTADLQSVDKSVEMSANEDRTQFKVKLPGDSQGLTQNVTYRIEAGDAISRDYQIAVVAAPTIVVEKLEYDFPRYTQKPREIRERAGDIRALEGTKVTIHAQANHPIHAAYIEFDPKAGETNKSGRIQMQASGTEATGSFVLELAPDRMTPKYGTYQISFVTVSGHDSQYPALHTIDVIRDLAPEVEILTPKEQTIEVPENSQATIEVRAIDPDFALSRVGLKLSASGKELADKLLLQSATGHAGQSITKFNFRPSEFKLKAGDEVAYWATAADNRTAPKSGLAEPNTERTKNYFIKITPADPNAKPMANEGENQNENADNPPPMPGDNPEKPNQNPNQERQDNGAKQDQPQQKNPQDNPQDQDQGGKEGEQGSNNSGSGGKSKMPMEGAKEGNDMSQGGGESGKEGKNDKNMSDKKDMPDMSGGTNAGNQGGEGNQSDKPMEGGKQNGMGRGEPGASASGQKPDGSQEGGNETSSDNTTGQPSGDKNRQGGKASPNGQKQEGGAQGQQEKADDGKAFEDTLKHLLEQAAKAEQNKSGTQGGEKQPMPGEQNSSDNKNGPSQEDFDKLPEHMKEKLKELLKKQQQQGGAPKTDKAPAGLKNDQTSPKSSAQGGAQENAANREGGEEQQNPGPTGQSQSNPENATGQKPMGAGSDKKQGAGASNERSQGETGKPDDKHNTAQEKPSKTGEPKTEDERQGGLGNNGQSGAGQASEDKKGAAQAQEANRDKPKTQKPAEQAPSKAEEAQSPSGSKKQSDSQGGESGDRSGGGKKGPGQRTDAAGNDSAGKNSAADEGAGAAQQSGMGETSSAPGNKEEAKGQTGKAGEKEGNGSTTKKAPQGDRAGNDPTEGEKSENESENPMPAGSDDQNGGGKTGDFVTGGGKPSDQTGRSKFADADGPAAEKAKLDYAKSATDLVLEYLKDQQDKPNEELLKDLGWTQDDLKNFLDRWAAAKRDAAANPEAKRDLDEALKGLGLRPGGDKLRRAEIKSDNVRGLGDVGPTGGPPSKYLDQFRAFKKGAAREK